MIQLTHAEARELLADLALEADNLDPTALERLAGEPLAEHLAACSECGRDLAAWQRTHAAVRTALVDPADPAHPLRFADMVDDELIQAPDESRSVVRNRARIGIMQPSARPRSHEGGRTRRLPTLRRFLPLVAVLAVFVVAGGALLDQGARLDAARAEAAALQAMTATLDRVLADPDHRVVELRGADGIPVGSISWSSRDLVVLTTALAAPPVDREYRCWVEENGKRSGVGRMWFAGGTAYWTGTLSAWGATSFGDSATFGISLEPISGSTGGPAILAGQLGG
jgi:anti-sigma factor RsiW